MKPGRMTHILTLERAAHGVNAAGTPETVWSPLARLRAEKLEQTATEFIRNYGAAEETVTVFRTHFFPGVTTADRIMFGGEAFNLKEIVVRARSREHEFRCVRTI